MKVIFLADVKGIGKRGDVKDEREGYVRNFLLPRKLVVVATPEELKKLEVIKKKQDAEHLARVETLKKEAAMLGGTVISFALAVGEKNETFGSVTARDVDAALHEKGITHGKTKLPHPLKGVGDHSVEIDFGEGVIGTVTVQVRPKQL